MHERDCHNATRFEFIHKSLRLNQYGAIIWKSTFQTTTSKRVRMATASSDEKTSQRPSNGDHRLVNKTLRRLEKLHESCTDPRLGLRNSPPYLLELVPDTASALRRVWEPYRGLGVLTGRAPAEDEAAYLRVHARNLLEKTDRALLLFKEGKEKMFDETSSYRYVQLF